MLVYRGGQEVEEGTYWNVADGCRIDAGDSERLPGGAGTVYLRMAPAVMLVVGPVTGMVYFLLLPVLTLGVVIQAVARRLWTGLSGLVGHLAYFEWRPTESYLGGRKRRRKGGGTS